MKIFIAKFWVVLSFLIAGCNAREEAPTAQTIEKYSTSEFRSAPAETNAEAMQAAGDLSSGGVFGRLASRTESNVSKNPPLQNRMVIKTAAINCEVAKYDDALAQIQNLATQYGGYFISATTQTHDNNVKSGSLTLRVEAKNFDAALQDIKKLTQKVEQESLQGNDVTEEFYDLTARLENKRKAEKRYQEILATAKNTKDILEVEQALTNVREEIERMEGRKRFLEDQVALSTITVNLHEPYPLVASGQYGFFAKMRRGVEEGLAGFADVLSACITLVIAGIPLFVMLFLMIWIFKRYRRRAKAAQLAKATMAEKKE